MAEKFCKENNLCIKTAFTKSNMRKCVYTRVKIAKHLRKQGFRVDLIAKFLDKNHGMVSRYIRHERYKDVV